MKDNLYTYGFDETTNGMESTPSPNEQNSSLIGSSEESYSDNALSVGENVKVASDTASVVSTSTSNPVNYKMDVNIYGYNYDDTDNPLITESSYSSEYQIVRDAEQDARIQENTLVNQQQSDNIGTIISVLEEGGLPISGGTWDFDAGSWN